MNEDVLRSRARISRRRALSLGGTVSLGGVLAACSSDADPPAATPSPSAAGSGADALLERAETCVTSKEETQGPYWFDVDSIRSDIREDRPGTELSLALRVQDISACASGGAATPVADCVVEIWHCDAGGVYSGFESGAAGPGGGAPPSGGPSGGPGGPGGGLGGTPPSGPPPSGAPGAPNPGGGEGQGGPNASGPTSSGSYSQGNPQAETSDDGTYLRGAQVADATGVVRFTTIFPGWYRGRTTHIHCKIHIDKKTVLTSQLFVDDAITDAAYEAAPYSDHPDRDTRNDDDSIYDATGLLTVEKTADTYAAALNLGITR